MFNTMKLCSDGVTRTKKDKSFYKQYLNLGLGLRSDIITEDKVSISVLQVCQAHVNIKCKKYSQVRTNMFSRDRS